MEDTNGTAATDGAQDVPTTNDNTNGGSNWRR
jgi:hypothetical protein